MKTETKKNYPIRLYIVGLLAVFCVILLILCLAAIAGDTYNPFIYFQF